MLLPQTTPRLLGSRDGCRAESNTEGTFSTMCSMTATKLEIYVLLCLNAKVLPHNLCSASRFIHYRVCAKFGNGACMWDIRVMLRLPQSVFEPLLFVFFLLFRVMIGTFCMAYVWVRLLTQAHGCYNFET